MYSIKEKNKHLRDLNAVQHAERDLDLLRQLDPRNDQLPSLSLSPRRNAEKILYNLLDVATVEEIRLNRRSQEEIEADEAEVKRLADEAEAEAKRQADEAEAEAEAKKLADEASKAKDSTTQQKKTSSQKKTSTQKLTGETS